MYTTPLGRAGGLTRYMRRLTDQTQRVTWSALVDSDGQALQTWHNTLCSWLVMAAVSIFLPLLWPDGDLELANKDLGPLMIENALSKGQDGVLRYLLEAGLRFDATDSRRRPNLVGALQDTSSTCLELAMPHLTGLEIQQLFCDYAARGLDEMIKVLLASARIKGLTPKTEKGTAMYQACAAENKISGHIDCMRLLLPLVPDINRRETVIEHGKIGEASPHPKKERTVLHALAGAWSDGNHAVSSEIFRLLLEAGADLKPETGWVTRRCYVSSLSRSTRACASH